MVEWLVKYLLQISGQSLISSEMSVVGEKYYLYHYEPKKVPAIIFLVLFGISSILHIFQLVRKRTWYFIPFVIGGACKRFLDLFV